MTGGDDSQRGRRRLSGFARDRDRLVAAFAKAAADHGYADLTIEQVVAYSGLPREIFDLHFESKEQGLVAAQDVFLERLMLEAAGACNEGETWPQQVRAGLGAVLTAMVEASSLARVFAIEATAASLVAAERQFAALDEFATLLHSGREHIPAAASLPASTERGLVGGISSIVSVHLLMEEPQAIPRLEPELVEFLLIPFVGEVEARRVALA